MSEHQENAQPNTGVELREFQLFQLGILKEFQRVCDEHGLRWWVGYGTLLGAARHQGFIPWDDDVDVIMPSEDYLRFREVARTSLSDGFYLQTHEDNPCNFIFWQRIGVKDSTSMPYEYADIHAEWGVCIDIFPVYPFPAADHPDRAAADKNITAFKRLSGKYEYRHDASAQGSFARKMYYRLMGAMPNCVNVPMWRRAEKKLLLPFDDSVYSTAAADCEPETFSLADFAETVMLPFEDDMVPAPVGYKNILTAMYGDDWMEIPPEGKRVCHSGGGSEEVLVSLTEPYEKYLK